MRGGMRPALILGSSPDGFCGSIGSHSAGLVEGNAQVVTQGRLSLSADLSRVFMTLKDPLSSDVWRCCRAGGLRECRYADQHDRHDQDDPACRAISTALMHD